MHKKKKLYVYIFQRHPFPQHAHHGILPVVCEPIEIFLVFDCERLLRLADDSRDDTKLLQFRSEYNNNRAH